MNKKLFMAVLLTAVLSSCQYIRLETDTSNKNIKPTVVNGEFFVKNDVDVVYNIIQSEFKYFDVSSENHGTYTELRKAGGFKHLRVPGARYEIVESRCKWVICAWTNLEITKQGNKKTKVKYRFSDKRPQVPAKFEERLKALF